MGLSVVTFQSSFSAMISYCLYHKFIHDEAIIFFPSLKRSIALPIVITETSREMPLTHNPTSEKFLPLFIKSVSLAAASTLFATALTRTRHATSLSLPPVSLNTAPEFHSRQCLCRCCYYTHSGEQQV